MSPEEKFEADRVGEATVRRFLDQDNDIMVLVGDFAPLFAAYLDHVRRWETIPDGLSQTLMRQGLGAATLHLACRPPGEITGWTINFHKPPTNVFLTGDSAERTVTGRIFTENVRPSEASRMYVQTSRAGEAPIQSVVGINGLDLLQIFEEYYEHSEQTSARFFEITDTEFIMLLALPDVNEDWLRSLGREEAIGLTEDKTRPLDERTYRFQCGCSPEKMARVVRAMFEQDPGELFRGDESVEVFCPRCGRRWAVQRKDVDGREGNGRAT